MAMTFLPSDVGNHRADSTNPATLEYIENTNISKLVASFLQGVTETIHGAMFIPVNYFSGDIVCRFRWRTTATVGSAYFNMSYFYNRSGDVWGNGTHAIAAAFVNSGAGLINEGTLTLSADEENASILGYLFQREGANVLDTITGNTVELLSVQFEYISSVAIQQNYIWIPANAFILPSSSTATYTTKAVGGIAPWVIQFPTGVLNYAFARMTIPSNFEGAQILL